MEPARACILLVLLYRLGTFLPRSYLTNLPASVEDSGWNTRHGETGVSDW